MQGRRIMLGAALAGLLGAAALGADTARAGDEVSRSGTGASGATPVFDPGLGALLGRGQEQVYVALLRPMNTRVSGGPVRGIAVVRVDGDRIDVTTLASGLSPGEPHMQHIHGFVSGDLAACPAQIADANKDGVIDVLEGLPYYGPILVPLDSDLSDLGAQTYPTPSAAGVLRYEQRGSVSAIEAALGAPLELERRVVALHGIPPATELPATTGTLPGMPPQLTVPVACGELVRVR
jgi:hypothetical protein